MSGGFNPINLVSQAALAVATGGTSMLVQAAIRAVVTAVVQQVIQQVGQQLGLPPQVTQFAQQAFDTARGGFGGQALGGGVPGALGNLFNLANLTPAQQGQLQGSTDRAQQRMVNDMVRGINAASKQASPEIRQQVQELALNQIRQQSNDKSKEIGNNAVNGNGMQKAGAVANRLGIQGGFLVALASAMGAALDNKMNQLATITNEINGVTSKQAAFGEVTKDNMGKFQALGSDLQSLGALMQGVSQEMKSLQEALSTTLKAVGETQQGLARKQ